MTRATTLIYCLVAAADRPSAPALGAILLFFAPRTARWTSMTRTASPSSVRSAAPSCPRYGGWRVASRLPVRPRWRAAGIDPRVWALGVGIALWLVPPPPTSRATSAARPPTPRQRLRAAEPRRDPDRRAVLSDDACAAIGDVGSGLRQDLGSSAASAALGFTGFSAGMAAARLGGDWLNERLGAGAAARGGSSRSRSGAYC